MLITKKYVELNAQLHASRPGFGAAGARWADTVKELAVKFGTTDILDYGCGKGVLASSLPFAINEYDPAIPEKAGVPKPCDILVCTDVLEHIEPECLRAVLRHIYALTRKVAFLNISTRKANKSLKDGRNAHLIVNDSRWWDAVLSEFFEIDVVSLSPTEYNLLAYPKKLEKA